MFVARYGVTKRYPRAIRRWVAGGACAIGTPIVEGLVKDPWERPRPIRTILYAPTWEGGSVKADYTSLPEVGPALLEAMPGLAERGISVIMRPHPATGRRRPELLEMRDALFAAGARRGGAKTADFAEADVIISDISGVTAEFLFTEKPAILPASTRLASIGKDDARLAAEYPWVYRWRPEEESLIERLDALQASDPLRGKRAAVGPGHVPRAPVARRRGALVRHGPRVGPLAQDMGAGPLGVRDQATPRAHAPTAPAIDRAAHGEERTRGLSPLRWGPARSARAAPEAPDRR